MTQDAELEAMLEGEGEGVTAQPKKTTTRTKDVLPELPSAPDSDVLPVAPTGKLTEEEEALKELERTMAPA